MLRPNRMIANGDQAIDGIVCRPVMIDPTAARSGGIRDTADADNDADHQRQHVADHRASRVVVPIADTSCPCSARATDSRASRWAASTDGRPSRRGSC